MKTIYVMIVLLYSSILGHVVAFFKEITGRDDQRDHSGYQSFSEAVRSIALQVRLRFNAWLSGLQHSPTI